MDGPCLAMRAFGGLLGPWVQPWGGGRRGLAGWQLLSRPHQLLGGWDLPLAWAEPLVLVQELCRKGLRRRGRCPVYRQGVTNTPCE